MNFMKAVKAMKKGKKVRRQKWDAKYILIKDTDQIYNEVNDNCPLNTSDYEATDWKIVKEKKTLSDKIVIGDLSGNIHFEGYYIKDVKEALKEFIHWCRNEGCSCHPEYEEKANKIFGDRLMNN